MFDSHTTHGTGAEAPTELLAGIARRWGSVSDQRETPVKWASDGGGYNLKGYAVAGGGTLYFADDEWAIEFYDGSGVRIIQTDDGEWATVGFYDYITQAGPEVL